MFRWRGDGADTPQPADSAPVEPPYRVGGAQPSAEAGAAERGRGGPKPLSSPVGHLFPPLLHPLPSAEAGVKGGGGGATFRLRRPSTPGFPLSPFPLSDAMNRMEGKGGEGGTVTAFHGSISPNNLGTYPPHFPSIRLISPETLGPLYPELTTIAPETLGSRRRGFSPHICYLCHHSHLPNLRRGLRTPLRRLGSVPLPRWWVEDQSPAETRAPKHPLRRRGNPSGRGRKGGAKAVPPSAGYVFGVLLRIDSF